MIGCPVQDEQLRRITPRYMTVFMLQVLTNLIYLRSPPRLASIPQLHCNIAKEATSGDFHAGVELHQAQQDSEPPK